MNRNHESSYDNSYTNADFAWAFGAGFISPVGFRGFPDMSCKF